ncbi:YjbQ family protein [Candidatus Sumerlaeota bacterium]|nr:YjbQ family protein [Candidatus Sumerlaeota bacterium]
MIKTSFLNISSEGFTDIRDITPDLSRILNESQMENGTMTVFVPGSTGGVTTIEYEPGLVKDIREVLEKIAPVKADYHHHNTWHDDNGSAHVRAALMGPSLTIPFVNKELTLGTWQQVVFIDFDTRSRSRRLVVQIMGE